VKRERYLLDTCALIWLLQGNKRMKSFVEKNKDYYPDWAVSLDSLREVLYKKTIKKNITTLTYKQIISLLNDYNMKICFFGLKELDTLANLPYYKEHKDPNDRHIIATAITEKRTVVTGDLDFSLYEKNGLQLLEI
jgi:PIN domain nuclease of toxin-antitoxin system